MTKVQEQRLQYGKVCDMYYSIPCVKNMIAARQMDFVGKMIRGPPDRLSCNMITACCDHKRQVGRPQTTGKNFMVEIYASFLKTSQLFRLTDMAPYAAGSMKHQMRTTGANL